jgi:hypothetical protein
MCVCVCVCSRDACVLSRSHLVLVDGTEFVVVVDPLVNHALDQVETGRHSTNSLRHGLLTSGVSWKCTCELEAHMQGTMAIGVVSTDSQTLIDTYTRIAALRN